MNDKTKNPLYVTEPNAAYVAVDPQGSLMVEGIEDWINQLVNIGDSGDLIRMKDSITGATYLIKRIE